MLELALMLFIVLVGGVIALVIGVFLLAIWWST